DDAVGGADEGDVEGALRVGGLPQDLAGGRVQGGPGAAGDGLPGVRPGAAQDVGDLGGVTLGRVDAPPVGGRAVLDAAETAVARRADLGLPDDLAGSGVDRPVDTALLAGAQQLLRPAGDRVRGGEQVGPGAEVEVRPDWVDERPQVAVHRGIG